MDIPHPVTGFTPAQVQILKDSWAKIGKNPEETGTVVLFNYFTKYPAHLKYFKTFGHIPIPQLRSYPYFRAHGLRVMKALHKAMNLDEPAVLIADYTALGKLHNEKKIEMIAFTELKGVIRSTFRSIFKLDPTATELWGRLIDLLYSIMFENEKWKDVKK